MKISELIKTLELWEKLKGDLEVVTYDSRSDIQTNNLSFEKIVWDGKDCLSIESGEPE